MDSFPQDSQQQTFLSLEILEEENVLTAQFIRFVFCKSRELPVIKDITAGKVSRAAMLANIWW
jgi:hypothetical protein